MFQLFNRLFQVGARGLAYTLDWSEPELYIGEKNFEQLPALLVENKGIDSLLIVTDEGIQDAGLLDSFIKNLEAFGIQYEIYNQVEPNPSIEISEEIAIHFNKIHADALIAVGGGSVIDATKAAGIAISQPQKSLKDFKGLLRVRKETPYTIAVPTTAGTGSEATIASVLSDNRKQEKFTIMDAVLLPDLAILDSELTKTLPKPLIAGPGMDALTHAVEAYIGRSNTQLTEEYAKKTVQLIAEYLPKAYNNREDTEARENMLKASYYAGRAFTRAYVGYVHAMSHALTAYYGVPHGSTNATILPIVLRLYGDAITQPLAELAQEAGIAEAEKSDQENALHFIEWIEMMNERLGIQAHIPEIKEKDLDGLAKHAAKEANPLYPVPVLFNEEDLKQAYLKVKGQKE